MCYRLCELWQSFRKRCQDTEEKFHAKDPFEAETTSGEVFVKQEPPDSDNWEELQDEPSDEQMDDSIPETMNKSSKDNLMPANDFPGGSSVAQLPNQQMWDFSMKFISLRQAKRYLKESGLYCVDFNMDLPSTNYRCTKVSKTTQVQCRAQVKLHVVKKNEVHLYKSSDPHEHSYAPPVHKGTLPTQSQLKALVFMGKNRHQIKMHLQQKGFTCPSDASLDDHIKLHQMRMANLYKVPPRSKRKQCSKAVLKSD